MPKYKTVAIDEDTYRKIELLAEKNLRTKGAQVRKLVEDAVAGQQEEQAGNQDQRRAGESAPAKK